MSVFYRTTPLYWRGKELTVSVLRYCKRSAFIANLIITMLTYEADSRQKCHFPWGSGPIEYIVLTPTRVMVSVSVE